MKILIIGGTGLISTATTRALLVRGHEVTHFNRGIASAEFEGKVRVIVGDRTHQVDFQNQIVKAGTFDCVIDMICFRAEEARGTIRAFQGRTSQMVFCSTVDVYTKPARTFPITEDADRNPLREFSYAWEKAECERLFEQAYGRGDFDLTVIRPAHTYGEGRGIVDPFRSEPFYVDRIRKGKPLIVQGDGTSLWTVCHRDDVGRAIANAAGNERCRGKAYNVTGDECMTWDQYWQGVAEALEKPCPRIVHIPTDLLARVMPEPASWCKMNFQHDNIFSNEAARRDLGFETTISWRDGVRRVVKALDDEGKIPACEGYPWYDRLVAEWDRCGDIMQAALGRVDG